MWMAWRRGRRRMPPPMCKGERKWLRKATSTGVPKMPEANGQQSRAPYNESMMNQAGLEAPPSEGKPLAASPPAFQWEDWYKAVGGRTISIAEVNALLKQIHQDQY